ncbi:MAG TPA: RNA polymerase sigma factor [Planctomycetota bacterium]|nr:RNA polymerase sigma factor [Planctomycetota bacterium]
MTSDTPQGESPSPPETHSVALLQAYQDGDEEALNRLLARVYPRVERIVQARLGPALRAKVDAQDVTQESLIRALQGLKSFELREDASLIDWLSKIVEHEVLHQVEHFAAQKRDAHREERLERYRTDGQDFEFARELVDESAGPGTKVSRKEMAQIVDECLSEVRIEHREVILLRDYAGGSWSFVAERLERPSADAAMQLYRRARVELASKVQRRT